MNDEHVNPFDNDNHDFLALVNAAGQHSLWPAFADVPAGWEITFGPDARAACLAHIGNAWGDLRPGA